MQAKAVTLAEVSSDESPNSPALHFNANQAVMTALKHSLERNVSSVATTCAWRWVAVETILFGLLPSSVQPNRKSIKTILQGVQIKRFSEIFFRPKIIFGPKLFLDPKQISDPIYLSDPEILFKTPIFFNP